MPTADLGLGAGKTGPSHLDRGRQEAAHLDGLCKSREGFIPRSQPSSWAPLIETISHSSIRMKVKVQAPGKVSDLSGSRFPSGRERASAKAVRDTVKAPATTAPPEGPSGFVYHHPE